MAGCPRDARPRRWRRVVHHTPPGASSLVVVVLLSLCAAGAEGFKLEVPEDGLEPVQLVRKPAHAQGQLELTEQGAEVLRSLPKPFAVVSAVGPTRTGKSSLLGRAFLNKPEFFEVGTGVHSHTTGVWVTSKPVTVRNKGGKLSVLIVDTEGFHGVQEKTSRTYENNLFALSYLLSSTLIYNSQYPVDSHHIDELKSYALTATRMHRRLDKQGVRVTRNHPDLLWTVQNFNFFNLENSEMSGDSLLGNLTDSTMLDALGMEDEQLENLHGMFRSKSMAPVHRPHNDDSVLANLGSHPDEELKDDYNADLKQLRNHVFSALRPMEVDGAPLSGEDFLLNVERWLLYGHIHIAEDEAGLHFVDKRMESHVEEVLSEFTRETEALELKLNESARLIPMGEFRKSLDGMQQGAHGKLKSRAMFWNYTLSGSPLEGHLHTTIDQRARELLRAYTGVALKRLGSVVEKEHTEAVAKLRELNLRQYLKDAYTRPGRPAAKANAPDLKQLQQQVRALVKAGDAAVAKEASRYELDKDRLGAQYVEESKRWYSALEETVMFAYRNVKRVSERAQKECAEGELRDASVQEFHDKCGKGAGEAAEKALREKAAVALASQDTRFAEVMKLEVAAQRAALAPLLGDAQGAYARAARQQLERLAGRVLEEAEARFKGMALSQVLGSGLDAALDEVVKGTVSELDAEMAKLGMQANEEGVCDIGEAAGGAGTGRAADRGDGTTIHCQDFLTTLEQQATKLAEGVRRRRAGVLLGAGALLACAGVAAAALAARFAATRERPKLSAKI